MLPTKVKSDVEAHVVLENAVGLLGAIKVLWVFLLILLVIALQGHYALDADVKT